MSIFVQYVYHLVTKLSQFSVVWNLALTVQDLTHPRNYNCRRAERLELTVVQGFGSSNSTRKVYNQEKSMEQYTHQDVLDYINKHSTNNKTIYEYITEKILTIMNPCIKPQHYQYLIFELHTLEYLIDKQEEINFNSHNVLILSLLIWYGHIIECNYSDYYYELRTELIYLLRLQYKTHKPSGFLLRN